MNIKENKGNRISTFMFNFVKGSKEVKISGH